MKKRSCVFLCFAIAALAESTHSEEQKGAWVPPIHTSGTNRVLNTFQQDLEKYFVAGDHLLMPLGFLGVTNYIRNESEMKRLARNGITFIHRYDSKLKLKRAREDILNASKAGLPLALNLPYAKRDTIWWTGFLQELAATKQIVMWYLPEEPGLEGLPWLKELTELIDRNDPMNRPVLTYFKSDRKQVLAEAGKFMDCVVYGAYPGHGWTGGARLRIARRLIRANSSGAPAVMAALEAFKTKTLGWPEPKHVMFDAYLALLYEAKGIWWYGYGYTRNNPELLEAILGRARVINGPEFLGEVFLRGQDSRTVRARILTGPKVFPDSVEKSRKMYLGGKIYSALQWRAFEHFGNIYIIALNCCQLIKQHDPNLKENDFTITGEFSGFNKDGKVSLLDGKTEYNAQPGSLTVTLKPLGVGVFKVSK